MESLYKIIEMFKGWG